MKFFVVFLISNIILSSDNKFTVSCERENDGIWMEVSKMSGLLFYKCIESSSRKSRQQFFIVLEQCVKDKSLFVLDTWLKNDDIDVINGIHLVRNQKLATDDRNETSRENSLNFNEVNSDWKTQVFKKLNNLFNTHAIKIHFSDLEGVEFPTARRRRRQGMMPLMMFGVLALGMIMVPMGFQFLAVLGGKALLLAKMALILTSIQGLKKIATSNVNYGLYATPQQGNWHYDRQWPYNGEDHDASAYTNHNYYDVPNQQIDLLHPRIDNFYRKYVIEN